MIRRNGALLLALAGIAIKLAAGAAAAQGRAQNQPGIFDYYLLSLSWSPSFCETSKGNASRLQCGARPYSFVVHGLWPQYNNGFPESCQAPPPRLDRRIVDSMLDLMPAPALIYHEWDVHGTCSGLSPRDYFDTIRKARAAVTVPPEYVGPQTPVIAAPQELVDRFLKVNPGLPASGIDIDCDRTRLREVRICFSRGLQFHDCTGNRNTCRADKIVMPPVRGQ
jgi:ribonuclease T2